jgi:hypothetical protein
VESLIAQPDPTNQAAPLTPRWLSIERAADYCSLSPCSIRRLLAAGKLTPHRPVRGRIVIDRLQLDALVAGSTASIRVGRGKHRTSTPALAGRNGSSGE